MESEGRGMMERLARSPALRALRYPDFRILWFGAFISFIGSQVQTLAQGYLVFDLTGNAGQLAMVSFAMTLPISFFGPFAGVVSDLFDRRLLLFATSAVNAVGPLFLGLTLLFGKVQYWHFLVVSVVSGIVACVELPTRQAVVRNVVDERDLSSAIPAQASTFNLARVVGPALGALIYKFLGPAACFLFNGVSFFALAFAAFLIKSDLRAVVKRTEPIRDLIFEGMRFTLKDPSLRLLFLMESAASVFGTFYISLMPAMARNLLGLDETGLGQAFSFVGAGAIVGLVLAASISHLPYKALTVHAAMVVLGFALLGLTLAHSVWVAFPLFFVLGMATILQFNTTNTLFQLLAPPKLRGRVLSMHMWAIAGVAPIGIFVFGWAAELFGLRSSIGAAAGILILLSALALTQWGVVREPDYEALRGGPERG
ncbi:MAG: MFS transporter [Fimbriimonadaceae bacterium]|nr:MFS transporter [Fimbriimonadaceae bacterium]QYK55404.1 MAG: MFS transporter [Fimbriimonadaceae bacterium]